LENELELLEVLNQTEANLHVEQTSEDENILGKLRYTFIVADKKNSNDRTYPSNILAREIKRFGERLAESNIAGQLNHPQLGAHSELDRISHIITSADFDKDSKQGIAESAILRTTKGKDLMVLLKASVPLGASVRGRGQLDQNGYIKEDYELLSIDLVSAPSFGRDTAITAKNLIESGNSFFTRSAMTEDEKAIALYERALEMGYKGDFSTYLKEVYDKRTRCKLFAWSKILAL
jgi:hypothetical protein